MEFDESKPYAIASVIIKKNVSPEDALQHALNITKKKKIKMTETKNTYRFRNLPKTKFSDYRSKKINKNITLVFGELKPEFARLSGRGFLDYFRKGYDYVKEKIGNVAEKVGNVVDTVKEKVKDVFSPALDYNNKTKAMLQQYGNETITKMTVYRKPLDKYIPVVLNAVSLGKWNEVTKKYGFDTFFHLSLVVVCKGESLNVEKLEVISISKEIPSGKGVDSQEVPLQGKSFTLNQMMEKGLDDVGKEKWFKYSALGANNCQNFVSYLLKGQGLYNASVKSFVFQDIKSVVDELPDYVKKFAQGATNIASVFDKLSGNGKNREQALKDQLHTHFGSRVSKKYMPQISAYKSGFLAGWDLERQQAPSEFKDNLVEVWARGYDDGREAKQRYEEDTESDIVSMDTKGSGMSGGNQEMDKFIMFLKQKGIEKKPSDTQLKKLYKEFKGVKRLTGAGFWDDFKRGFNMVFEPASKYILKPLLASTGTPMGLAGVAGLSALGYGRNELVKKETVSPILYPTPRHPPKQNLYGKGKPSEDDIENMQEDFGQNTHPIWMGSGHSDLIDQFHKWLVQNAHRYSNSDLRSLFKKFKNK